MGSVTRFRHSITPVITYNYAPAADISSEFLRALNKSKQGYLGALAQNRVTLSLSHVLEAKVRNADTSSTAEPKKIKILAMNFSPLSYDFERARVTHRSGFVTDAFSSDFTTDLIPGFRGAVRYSLYQGDILSDSARFKPFREGIDASFSLNGQSGIFGVLSRVFGRAVPTKNPQIERVEASPDDALANRVASMPVAGISARNRQFNVPETEGWQATLTYSSTRQRPPTGNGIVIDEDPTSKCLDLSGQPDRLSAVHPGRGRELERWNGDHQNDGRRSVHPHSAARQSAVADDLPPHAEVVGIVGNELRLPGEEVRKPPGVAPEGAARLEGDLCLHASSQRELRVQLLHCPQRGARPKIQL